MGGVCNGLGGGENRRGRHKKKGKKNKGKLRI